MSEGMARQHTVREVEGPSAAAAAAAAALAAAADDDAPPAPPAPGTAGGGGAAVRRYRWTRPLMCSTRGLPAENWTAPPSGTGARKTSSYREGGSPSSSSWPPWPARGPVCPSGLPAAVVAAAAAAAAAASPLPPSPAAVAAAVAAAVWRGTREETRRSPRSSTRRVYIGRLMKKRIDWKDRAGGLRRQEGPGAAGVGGGGRRRRRRARAAESAPTMLVFRSPPALRAGALGPPARYWCARGSGLPRAPLWD